jgi:two-component system OmpR family response regulator
MSRSVHVSRHVLIVDDSELVREAAKLALEIDGLVATAAEDGESALRAATADPPDAILLDVVMPGLDGPQTLARLRADERTASVPIAFLTARAEDPQESAALVALGAVAVIAKPFTVPELGPAVRAAFGWHHQGG